MIVFIYFYGKRSYSFICIFEVLISREVKDKRRLDDELDNDEPADDGDGGDAMECRGDSDVVEYTHFFQMNQQTV